MLSSNFCWELKSQKKIPLIGSKFVVFEGEILSISINYLNLINPLRRDIFPASLWPYDSLQTLGDQFFHRRSPLWDGRPNQKKWVFSFSKNGMDFRSLKVSKFHWYNSHWRLFSREQLATTPIPKTSYNDISEIHVYNKNNRQTKHNNSNPNPLAYVTYTLLLTFKATRRRKKQAAAHFWGLPCLHRLWPLKKLTASLPMKMDGLED